MSVSKMYRELHEMGIIPAVMVRGRTQTWDREDGLLGSYRPGTELTLCVGIQRRRQLVPKVVHRDQTEDLTPYYEDLKPVGGDQNSWQHTYYFRLWGRGPKGYSLWPKQQIQVLTFRRECRFAIWQISVSFQDLAAYFRIQKLWEGQAVEKTGEGFAIQDPYFQIHWWALLDFLKEQSKRRKRGQPNDQKFPTWDKWVDQLADTNREMPPPKHVAALKNGEAIVQWWNVAMNTGAVVYRLDGKTTNGKVNAKDIEGMSGFRSLEEGELITFDDVESRVRDKGPDKDLPYTKLLGVRRIS